VHCAHTRGTDARYAIVRAPSLAVAGPTRLLLLRHTSSLPRHVTRYRGSRIGVGSWSSTRQLAVVAHARSLPLSVRPLQHRPPPTRPRGSVPLLPCPCLAADRPALCVPDDDDDARPAPHRPAREAGDRRHPSISSSGAPAPTASALTRASVTASRATPAARVRSVARARVRRLTSSFCRTSRSCASRTRSRASSGSGNDPFVEQPFDQ